jgi:uncharacterized protein YbaR (Trm112 family)
MLKCPVCRGSLPFSESFGLHGPVVCPHCSNELRLKRWRQGLISLGAYVAANSLSVLLRARGLGVVALILASAGSFIVVFVLLQIWLGRYRLKPPPLSITRTE